MLQSYYLAVVLYFILKFQPFFLRKTQTQGLLILYIYMTIWEN